MAIQTFHAALTDLDTTAQVPLGAIYELDNKRYKYVKFSGTTTIAVGDVLCYVLSDTAGQTVDGANTAAGAGVAVAAVASGTVVFGWIQVSGMATLSTALAGSPAAGDALSTNGAAAPAVTKASAANMQHCAYAFNVSGKIVQCFFPN